MKFEKGGGSINGKPTCVTYGKRHYCECLTGTGSFFGCVKEGHKVRYCPTIAARGREGKQVLIFQRMILQIRGVSMHSGLKD